MKFRYTRPVDHGFIAGDLAQYPMFFSSSAGSGHIDR
jgi:hypothetical protein